MKDYVLSLVWAPFLTAQIVLVFAFGLVSKTRFDALVYAGYAVWLVSAFLGWWPILYLKNRGGVSKGKSYVHTTALVTSGIYSIIRHPQYTAGILFSLALVLVSQHLIIAALGMVVSIVLYIDIIRADEHEIRKFGEEYVKYMKKVPRTNLVLGIIRRLRRKQ
jgi:protein-S-isoprenylcysteine O-methyltransferase Ste14